MLKYFIISSLIFFEWSNAACSFTYGDNTLDLTSIQAAGVIEFLSTTQNTYYNYSACANNALCALSSTSLASCMVSQGRGTSQTDCAAYLATYTAVVTPIYIESTQTWTFSYSNGYASGGCSSGRKLNLIYICDANIATYDKSKMSVAEGPSCTYNLTIYSNLACPGGSCTNCNNGGGSSSSSGGLSGGWVFIIILICVFFLYCTIGYAYMGSKNEHGYGDIKNNVPNKSFWTLLPKYFMAGCGVTKDFIVGLANRTKGGNESSTGALASNTTE